jgi:hypothetical protein
MWYSTAIGEIFEVTDELDEEVKDAYLVTDREKAIKFDNSDDEDDGGFTIDWFIKIKDCEVIN